jgi:capsular exopolysaccharide synthesis family protein
LVALQKQPTYQSYMQLLVEPNYQNNNVLDLDESKEDVDYATQLNLMRSSQLLNRAVAKLQPKYPDIDVYSLKEYLSIYQLIEGEKTETKIVQAIYRDDDYIKTKEVLEAIKEVYLEYNLEQQDKRLTEGLSFIDRQIPEARQEMLAVEKELKELRTKYNLIAPEQEATNLAGVLNQIKQERESVKAEYRQVSSKYNELQKQYGVSDQNTEIASPLSQSSAYQALFDRLQEIERELAEERTRFTDSNPIIQDLITKRDSTKAQLTAEAKKALSSETLDLKTTVDSNSNIYSQDSDTEFINSIAEARSDLVGLEERDRALANTQEKLKQQLNQFPEVISQYTNLVKELEVKQDTLQKLLAKRQEIGIELDRGGFKWEVVEPPQWGYQIGPNTTKDLMLGMVVAFFMGGVGVFIRESIDHRLYDSKQIEEQTSLPVLGTTPGLAQFVDNPILFKLPFLSSKTTFVQDVIAWQPFRESLDIICENLQMLSYDSPFRSLAITSAIAGEGKSTLALGLAFSVARRQQRVLVIDANLRNSSLHKQLRLPNQQGLTNLLSGETLAPYINRVSLLGENVDLLTAGPKHEDPVKLLSSPLLADLISEFEQTYDLVIVDTPPVLGMVDAIKTASSCSGTVMVVGLDRSETNELIEATSLLSKLNILGIVANGDKNIAKKNRESNPYLLPEAVSTEVN